MSARNIRIIAGRIMRQVVRGKRFYFFFWAMPVLLLLALKLALAGNEATLALLGAGERPLQLAALFAQCAVFIGVLTIVVRDRIDGTLDRMFVSSFRPVEIFLGYMAGLTVVMLIQAPIMMLAVHFLFETPVWRPELRLTAAMALQLLLMGYIGVGLAFMASMAAQNLSQVSTFLIALFIPSALASGLFFDMTGAHPLIQWIGCLVPVRYMAMSAQPTLALAVYFAATVLVGSWVFRESQ